ncbi:UNVERIFIED_CONTAM: protein NRT1/ PTR FAMILY 5.5 [Sesamum angustifolium]|uniref:Protein NRT1/ PTR FAMILY 5.5 n=1 Tax=Sesamum angustifolium TaxID=2727405 RepID=A0AAW2N3G4_9LAMI
MGFLTMSTPPVLANAMGTCSEYKPECIGQGQKVLFYTALPLIAFGMSGHLTSWNSFIAEQFSGEEDDLDENTFWRFLSVFLLCVITTIVAVLALPYINHGLFGLGFQPYVLWLPLSCFSAALVPTSISGQQEALDDVLGQGCNSDSYKTSRGTGKNIWRLCRVTEVEETKTIIRMIPVWMTFILCGVVSSIGLTYFIEQLDHLNHKVGRLTVPSVALLWFYEQAQNQCTKLYAKFSNALAESGSRKFAPAFGIAVSMILAILCCITAAKVENRRLGMVQKHGLVEKPDETVPMTMFWLLPQFVLLGAFNGISITAPFASSSTNPLPRHEITCSFSLVACLVLGYLGVFFRYMLWEK